MGAAEKKEFIKRKLKDEHKCSGACTRCTKQARLIDLMADSNIPVGYWLLSMKNFEGPPLLREIVEKYTSDIEKTYMSGRSVCFAGSQGTGKTMSSTCILKSALKRGFSSYYTTASDVLNSMTNINKIESQKILRGADFLVIDELDSRFFVSNNVKELFSGIYESIFRYRSHNTLPTILCTNEIEGISNVFYGAAVQSIESLNSQYLTIYPIAGLDFRKNG